jgi:hypothetical protein
VRKLFGADVAERVGAIWGFGEDQELRNMYTRTRQPGLWLIAVGLAQAGSETLGAADQGNRGRPVPARCWAAGDVCLTRRGGNQMATILGSGAHRCRVVQK